MNELFIKLANENFYASADAMRNFFMLGVNMDEKAFLDEPKENKTIISNYGEEFNTIYVTGMMLRERSWLTDMGYATSTEEVIEGIQETLAEGKKVRLIMNTGGGLVSGTSNLADIIYENRENIEGYATGMVASAGMWVFASAGVRFAEPTTVLGSIGVVTSVFDDEKYWENYGIVWKEVVSENAKNKRPDVKSASGLAEIKRYLTSLESVFINSVSKSLDMSKEDIISNFHEGGLITGQDALEINVINDLMSYDMNVATMPTELQEDEPDKIESTLGEGVMITQEQLDAVQGQLDEAQSSLKTAEDANTALTDKLATANATIEAHASGATSDVDSAKADTLKVCGEIVGMALEHGVDKATALKMVATGDLDKSASVG